MKVHVYPAADGWRWHCKADNGRIVAESGEAYKKRHGCIHAARRVFRFDSRKVQMEIDRADGSYERSESLR